MNPLVIPLAMNIASGGILAVTSGCLLYGDLCIKTNYYR